MPESTETGVFPSAFPSEKYTDGIKFVQDENFKGRMSLDVFRTLWSRGCVEIDNFPDPDLQNDIHPVFARERFPHLRDTEYDYIRPATTLASRFIQERNYMGFWLRLCAGRPETRPISGKAGHEFYIGAIDGFLAMKTAVALEEIAQHITWFNIDRQWSERDPRRVGEVFMDADYEQCQRYKSFHDEVECGSCSYCRAEEHGLCCICRSPDYQDYGEGQQQKAHRVHSLGGCSRTPEEELIDAFEADVVVSENLATPSMSANVKVPGAMFKDIRIGLHDDMVKHIRDPKRDSWTRCERLRFQFGLAATLVHELAHPFWYFTQKRCWSCFNPDPWLSETEPRHRDGPEVGISWEYWAFGMRAPDAGRIREFANEPVANIFQRHQWNYSVSTMEAGESNVQHDLVVHNFITPFEFIYSWFQESTWQSIATKGRVAGRPSYRNAVVLRTEAVKFRKSSGSLRRYQFGTRTCAIEPYQYAELVENGGLMSRARRPWMYGERFATGKQADRRLRQLLTEHNNRKKALADMISKAKLKSNAKRKPNSTKRLKSTQ
ncbi:hypothetical protein J1614_008605 [Plenodomus biglobosus]|nr:hypothetical protein J1614_008605 [Plenodomus biglobosus]